MASHKGDPGYALSILKPEGYTDQFLAMLLMCYILYTSIRVSISQKQGVTALLLREISK